MKFPKFTRQKKGVTTADLEQFIKWAETVQLALEVMEKRIEKLEEAKQ